MFLLFLLTLLFRPMSCKLIETDNQYVFTDEYKDPRYETSFISIDDNYWTHSTLSNITQNAILAVMKPLPYKSLVKPNGTFEPDIGALMKYELPLLFPSFVAFQIAISVPIVTAVFLCWMLRRQGRHEETVRHPGQCISVSLIVVCFIITVLIFFLPSIGERLWSWPIAVSDTAHKSLNDITIFNQTVTDSIEETIRDNLVDYIQAARSEVEIFANDVAEQVMQDVDKGFTESARKFHDVVSLCQTMITSIGNLEAAISIHLGDLSGDIQTARIMLGNISQLCIEVHIEFCDTLLEIVNIPELDHSRLRLRPLAREINSATLTSLNSTSLKSMKSNVVQYIIGHMLSDPYLKQNITQLETTLQKYGYHFDRLVRQIDWGGRQLQFERSVYYIDTIKAYGEYHSFQRAGFIYGLSCLMLVFASAAVLVVICGIQLDGKVGRKTTRSRYNCSVSVLCYGSILITLIYTITIVSFLVGTHLQLVCRSINDRSVFTDYLDNPKMWWNVYPIAAFLYGRKTDVIVTAKDSLDMCERDRCLYNVLNVSAHVNVSDIISNEMHFEFGLPTKDHVYKTTWYGSLTRTGISPSLLNQINQISNLRVPSMETLERTSHIKERLARYRFKDTLTSMKQQIYYLSRDYSMGEFAGENSDAAKTILQRSRNLQRFYNKIRTGTFNDIMIKLDRLNSTTFKLMDTIPKLRGTKRAILLKWTNYSNILNTTITPRIVKFTAFKSKLPPVNEYSDNIRRQLETNVGTCRVIGSLFDAFYNSVCTYSTDVFTALWVTLAITDGLLLVIMFCIGKLIAQFTVTHEIDDPSSESMSEISYKETEKNQTSKNDKIIEEHNEMFNEISAAEFTDKSNITNSVENEQLGDKDVIKHDIPNETEVTEISPDIYPSKIPPLRSSPLKWNSLQSYPGSQNPRVGRNRDLSRRFSEGTTEHPYTVVLKGGLEPEGTPSLSTETDDLFDSLPSPEENSPLAVEDNRERGTVTLEPYSQVKIPTISNRRVIPAIIVRSASPPLAEPPITFKVTKGRKKSRENRGGIYEPYLDIPQRNKHSMHNRPTSRPPYLNTAAAARLKHRAVYSSGKSETNAQYIGGNHTDSNIRSVPLDSQSRRYNSHNVSSLYDTLAGRHRIPRTGRAAIDTSSSDSTFRQRTPGQYNSTIPTQPSNMSHRKARSATARRHRQSSRKMNPEYQSFGSSPYASIAEQSNSTEELTSKKTNNLSNRHVTISPFVRPPNADPMVSASSKSSAFVDNYRFY